MSSSLDLKKQDTAFVFESLVAHHMQVFFIQSVLGLCCTNCFPCVCWAPLLVHIPLLFLCLLFPPTPASPSSPPSFFRASPRLGFRLTFPQASCELVLVRVTVSFLLVPLPLIKSVSYFSFSAVVFWCPSCPFLMSCLHYLSFPFPLSF